MPEEGSGNPIIIKKIKKTVHGGHHGGAWKVAYADFVTAMMALFLVLWLVAMMSIQAKKGVAEYFRSYSIFKGDKAGGGKGMSVLPGDIISVGEKEEQSIKEEIKKVKIANQIADMIQQELGELKNQVLIKVTDEGIRMELVDKIGSPMFELGKANLVQVGNKIVDVVSESLKNIDAKIIIEGHTDSYQYSDEDYTNWELSADRANAVRRALIKNGIEASKILKVVSLADTLPLNEEDPYDPINRRVSILIVGSKNKKDAEAKNKSIEVISNKDFLDEGEFASLLKINKENSE
ncbi:MAG: motility protein MotB [Candidatus Schekmanbacteria bacterium]|nr:MAG: motility protein MotB [Candidatus Schekmanbacteria bacterium]